MKCANPKCEAEATQSVLGVELCWFCADLLIGELDKKAKPLLAQNESEALRMAYGGRQMVSLKESKILDTQRLNESPLFERKLF